MNIFCNHKNNQKWNDFMSAGQCMKCDAYLVPSGIPGEVRQVPAIPNYAATTNNPNIIKQFELKEMPYSEVVVKLVKINKK